MLNLSKNFLQMITPTVLFEAVNEFGNEEGTSLAYLPRNIMWGRRFESNEICLHMGLCYTIIPFTAQHTFLICISSGYPFVCGYPNSSIISASAGLHDENLGFVSQTPTVRVVENFEDSVIMKNIWLLFRCFTPQIPSRMPWDINTRNVLSEDWCSGRPANCINSVSIS